MTGELSDAYQRELDAIRRLAAEFAEAHPKIARRLRLTGGTVDDPHVERLLEGVAFLTARTQQRLDDEFPEINDALLGVLYPHYLAPVPSGAIVRLGCKPDLKVPVDVPVGAELETDPADGIACRFRTTAAVRLWPIEVAQVRLTGLPLAAPAQPASRVAKSSLQVSLRLADPNARFDELVPESLRFFIRRPPAQAIRLYELLCQHTIGVALADGPNDDRPTALARDAIRPVGFAPDEALYPWSNQSFSGFRLLAEYFSLPEKFMFFDIDGLEARTLLQARGTMDLFVYFDVAMPELERVIGTDALMLGCTPVVNLFQGACEPIRLDHWNTDYLVQADHQRHAAAEVWQVREVREIGADGGALPWRPLYQRMADDAGDAIGAYTLSRRPASGAGSGVGGRTEVRLAPADTAMLSSDPDDRVLSVDALLTHGDLPARLPFGGGQPALHPVAGLGAVTRIECLTPPTPSWRAPLREYRSWRLVSHLVLGRLSLTGGPDAASRLREYLRLYDVRDSDETRAVIASLSTVDSRDSVARVPGDRFGSFCRGLDVTLVFDADRWEESGLYLLAAVLERMLALHVTVNGFVRTAVRLNGRPDPVARFAPRTGHRALL